MIRRKKTQEAVAAINAGNYAQAEAILQLLWKEMPADPEASRLLLDCYLQQEKWDEAEHMIRTTGETLYGGSIDQDDLLHLFLLKKDVDAALHLAYEMITADPEFSDLHIDIGQQFKNAGFSERLIKFIEQTWADEKHKDLFLARHYAFVEQDNRRALDYVQQVLDTHPTDPLALQYRDIFQKNQKSQIITEARTQLSEGNTAEALPL
ncbi:MAG TPA: tetratricopeptide repeat protein, partial [Saprospiraceae bacterium]|nr:tetratricopeptide repeat protein [Saprospiraceae bacterium]HPI09220.1 tetratricopeptide repeat protein [Saprospiraceae bacterium]